VTITSTVAHTLFEYNTGFSILLLHVDVTQNRSQRRKSCADYHKYRWILI